MSHELIDTGAYFDGKEWHYGIRVMSCKQGCGYALLVPRKNGRLNYNQKKRLSFEHPIQDAIDSGLPSQDPGEFERIVHENIRAHHWASEEWLKIKGLRKENPKA